MTTNTMSIADAIYSRIDADLYKVAGPIFDIHSARLVLRLALTELATRIDEQQPQTEQPASLSILTVPARSASAGTSSGDPAVTMTAATEQPKKRPGRPPKTQAEPPAVSPYNIATSAPAPIGIDPDLVTITDDDPVSMDGILRRTETGVRHINGVPTKVTRQYVELR